MNDNRYTCRLHVATQGSSTARFKVPTGLNNVSRVRLVEAEINNALTTVREDNDTIYFNEFTIRAVHEGCTVDSDTITAPAININQTTVRLEASVTMFAAQMPRLVYDADSTMLAAQTAMNNPRAIHVTTGDLHNQAPENTYTVLRAGSGTSGSKVLSTFISPIAVTGAYGDNNQQQSLTQSLKPFAVRTGNVTQQPVATDTAVWNPLGVDRTDPSTFSGGSFAVSHGHCSPFRIIVPAKGTHNLIPGDPVALEFTTLNYPETPSPLRAPNGASYTQPTTLSSLQGHVVYVTPQETHVMVPTMAVERITLRKVRLRFTGPSNLTGCAQLGLGPSSQGLLVSSVLEGTTNPVYEARVYANASADYMGFKVGTSNPFVSGGTAEVLSLLESKTDIKPNEEKDSNDADVTNAISGVSGNTLTISGMSDGYIPGAIVRSDGNTDLGNPGRHIIESRDGDQITLVGVNTVSATGGTLQLVSVPPHTFERKDNPDPAHTVVRFAAMHMLQSGSTIHFSGQMSDSTSASPHVVLPEKTTDDDQVPRVAFGDRTPALNTVNPGRLIWTHPGTEPHEHFVGHPYLLGDGNLDITQNARVVLIELVVQGVGPIGNLHVDGLSKVFFARARLKGGFLALNMAETQKHDLGQHQFDALAKPREMTVRVYTEDGVPFDSQQTQHTFLFEFDTVGAHAGCGVVV